MPRIVSVPGTVMIAGWCSNLLDRLGLHHWTAPGSAHGVVDFLGIGAHYYNVADLCIIGGTPLFLLAAGYLGVRAILRPAVRSVPLAVRSVPLSGRSLAPADRGVPLAVRGLPLAVRGLPLAVRSVPLAGRSLAGAPLTGQSIAPARGGVPAYGRPSAYPDAGPRRPDGGRLARPLVPDRPGYRTPQPDQAASAWPDRATGHLSLTRPRATSA
jgi:hypothetical protein